MSRLLAQTGGKDFHRYVRSWPGLWSIALQKSLQSELDSFPGKGVPLEWPRRHPKAFGIH